MLSELLQLGGNTTLIGIVIVLLVLIMLCFIIWLISVIVKGSIERKKASKAVATAIAAPAPEPKVPEPAVSPVVPGISTKTVALIMAAVSAASDQPLSRLRFTAIRRSPTAANVWSASGIADIIANRQAYL